MRQRLGLALLLLLAARPAAAGLLTAAAGTLQTCAASCLVGCSRDGLTTGVGSPTNSGSCVTGNATADFIAASGANAVVFLVSLGGTATWTLEQSIDQGATWVPVGAAITQATALSHVTVTDPVGLYRSVITVSTAGTFLVRYRTARLTTQ